MTPHTAPAYGLWGLVLLNAGVFSQSVGTGADVMKRVAAAMVGGLATSFLMELLVYPATCLHWKWNAEVKNGSFGVQEALEPVEAEEPVLELR